MEADHETAMTKEPVQSLDELLAPYADRLARDMDRHLVEPGTPESLDAGRLMSTVAGWVSSASVAT